MRNLALMFVLAGVVGLAEFGILRNSMLYWNKIMKKYLIFLLIVFICPAYAQDFDHNDCYVLKPIEYYYQILLKRWRDGADGQGEGSVDSVVLYRMKRGSIFYDDYFADTIKKSPRMLQVREDLHHHRGLGIFLTEVYLNATAAKVLKKYYNIDVKDFEDYKISSTDVEYFYGMAQYLLVWVEKRNNEELIVYLIANATGEVVSTYKEKMKRTSPMKEKECEGKDGILTEF